MLHVITRLMFFGFGSRDPRGRARDNRRKIGRSIDRYPTAEYDFTRVRLRVPLILARPLDVVSATPTANYLAV